MGNEQRISSPRPRPPARVDCAACGGDDVLHDREPKAGPARAARTIGPVEALEQPRGRSACVDAGAVVDDAQHHLAVRPADREGSHSLPGRRSGSRSRQGFERRRGASAAAPRRSHPRRPRRPASPRPAPPVPRGSAATSLSTGSTGSAPSETTRVPDSSSARKSTRRSARRSASISRRACSSRSGTSSPGSAGELEQREEPRERRPELVRDRGREARAKLLVRGRSPASEK